VNESVIAVNPATTPIPPVSYEVPETVLSYRTLSAMAGTDASAPTKPGIRMERTADLFKSLLFTSTTPSPEAHSSTAASQGEMPPARQRSQQGCKQQVDSRLLKGVVSCCTIQRSSKIPDNGRIEPRHHQTDGDAAVEVVCGCCRFHRLSRGEGAGTDNGVPSFRDRKFQSAFMAYAQIG